MADFSRAALPSLIGFVLIVLCIGKTWWDSRLSFLSGAAYLVVLNALYFALKNPRRRRTLPG